MSPEQARGEELDARSDLFSLGSVLYVMATGQLAFGGATAAVIFDAILNRTPIAPSRLNPELPPKLDEIMSKLLDKDRNLRYQHAADLEADLRRLKRESDAHPTDFPARPTDATLPKDRSRPKLLLLASIALAAVAVVALFRTSRTSVLTERDVILLADFVNTTGDPQFDGGALKQGLASYLEQSPHLNIFPEDRVREALRYMARSPDESVTDAVAREICQREDIKAVLGGSIAALGAHYLITLDAVNCTSGESLVPREQREANSKEQVVEQLGTAASSLRANLGESLASLQRFDTPLERATTTSLEGLRSFTEGRRLNSAGAFRQAIPFLQKSVDLDPDFALGQYLLGTAYGNQNQWDRANPQTQLGLDKLTTAFNLRHRATELEKQSIAVYYQMRVLGDLNGARETSEFLKQIYQRDYPTRHLLGNIYAGMGRFEEALAEHEEAVRLRPNSALSRASVALDYAALHQLGHASEILNKAMQEKVEFPFMHGIRYEIAFMQGDANVMRQETEWAKGNPDGASQVLNAQARGALFSGRLGEVRKVFRDNRRWPHLNPFEPALLGFSLSQSALHGQTDDLATLAILGEPSRVLALIEELRKAAPQDTVLNFIDIPVAKAYLEIRAGNGTKAVDLLNTATPYERGYLRVTYTRGQAYLQAGLFNEAAAEFKKLIGHRGVEPLSVLYPLSHLGLGRAYAGAKDMARARKSYSDFLKIWSGADPDIPILIQAKQEYGRLISN
jgi:tetratricopeptide (TPR) repeat protein